MITITGKRVPLPSPIIGAADNYRVLGKEEDVTAVRQQHRNVYVERCRLWGSHAPSQETLASWWPGTTAVFK